jgi:dCMP deaminase
MEKQEKLSATKEKKVALEKRLKWDKRFMEIAKVVSTWSTCFQENRHVGSVIVRDKRIITTGYNGAPSGVQSCVEKGECLRKKMNIESGTRQELCYATHAEQNALVQAAKLGIAVDGATIYVTHRPCTICTKLIINAGIKRIVYGYNYPDEFSVNLLKEAGIELDCLPYDKEN